MERPAIAKHLAREVQARI